MLFWHQRDGDPAWLERVQRMADGLRKVAVFKDDYAYYPDGGVAFDFSYLKESGYRNTEEPSTAGEGFEGAALFYNSNQIGALCLWHATSGDQRALDLARRITRFVMQPRFWHAGSSPDVAGAERGHWQGHFHERMITLRALLWFAMATGDWRLKEFVRSSYEHSRNYGLARIGWNPGWTGPHPLHRNERTCESCGIAGQVGLAVRLSQAGLGDYWDDVDGYVRNHLVEQQFADPELIERARSTCYPDSRNWLGRVLRPGPGHFAQQRLPGALLPRQRRAGAAPRVGRDRELHGERRAGEPSPEPRLTVAGRRQPPSVRGQGGHPQQDGADRGGAPARLGGPGSG